MAIGIIGGTGFNDGKLFKVQGTKVVDTIFGSPSDVLTEGTICDVPCVILPRHGKSHSIMPSDVNFRANIWALKEVGCTHILATNASGGLQNHTQPGDIVILDQYMDRTTGREQTFYGGHGASLDGVLHMPMADPFCEKTRLLVIQAAKNVSLTVCEHKNEDGVCLNTQHPCVHTRGSCIVVNGPRFSTRCESNLFRSWGLDVIGMTLSPEVALAREAGLCYVSICTVTDYDCWKADERSVDVANVLAQFKLVVDKIKVLLIEAVKLIGNTDWTETLKANQEMITNARQDLACKK